MRILTVVSGMDLQNHTRRSTLLAIHKLNPEMEILQFNSLRNHSIPRKRLNGIKTYEYQFWIFEKFRALFLFSLFEYALRGLYWRSFFKRYDYIFLIDPNQYYLLPFTNRKNKIIYLLRDPGILQNKKNYSYEKQIIERADLILAVSKNLKEVYLSRYYNFQSDKVHLWSNAVDLSLWDYYSYSHIKSGGDIKIGMAGNINQNTDLDLIEALLQKRPEYNFEISGRIKLTKERKAIWETLMKYDNLKYLGFIDFDKLPSTVSGWNVGLLLEKKDNEYSIYYNHNKIYQYMALGLPFVSYDHNEDFSRFYNVGFIASTIDEYISMVDLAIKKTGLQETITSGLKYAEENSADKKAEEFLFMLNQL